MIREAYDDFNRFLRDREINNRKYKKLTREGVVTIESAKIKVGDVIIVDKVHFTGVEWLETDHEYTKHWLLLLIVQVVEHAVCSCLLDHSNREWCLKTF